MNVDNPEKQMHIQGLALRLYNPQSHQWSIYWANAADGVLEPNPMVGQFINGRGETVGPLCQLYRTKKPCEP